MKTVFCPSCQNEVEVVQSPFGADGNIVARCTICGSVINDPAIGSEFCETDTSISFGEESFVDDSISIPVMDQVLVTGYTPSVRQSILDKFTEKQVAREVTPCQNGEEMIVTVIDNLKAKNGGIDLIVTDVPMPFLNGINASIGLRAIERSYSDHDLIPILFLTNKPCDDTFKKVIKFLAPAKYATLGPVDNQEKLSSHIERVASLVAREKW